MVKRSNGQEVALSLQVVERESHQVVIDIVEYNARFTFSNVTGKISLVDGGRQAIDKSQPTITHVSKSVYAGMAKWAGSILNSGR